MTLDRSRADSTASINPPSAISNSRKSMISNTEPYSNQTVSPIKMQLMPSKLELKTVSSNQPEKDLKFETPRMGGQAEISDAPLLDEEKFRLADLRLKEIFLFYAKNHSSVSGKQLPFELINKGMECLTLAGITKLFKDYGITFNKLKLQFLFKRFSDDGYLCTYEQFLSVAGATLDERSSMNHLGGMDPVLLESIYYKFQCLQAF